MWPFLLCLSLSARMLTCKLSLRRGTGVVSGQTPFQGPSDTARPTSKTSKKTAPQASETFSGPLAGHSPSPCGVGWFLVEPNGGNDSLHSHLKRSKV